VGFLYLEPDSGTNQAGWTQYVLNVPPSAIRERYDSIRIIPSTGIENIPLGEMVLWNDPKLGR
jgi:hypothetical protein